MKNLFWIVLFLCCLCCGCWDNKETGVCLGGYQFVHKNSYLKIGSVSTEMMLQEDLNGIKYDDRRFHMDILEAKTRVGFFWRKEF